ncbi:MAG: MBL fold metallo-hydrolase [Lachnospiraceae bacterium]|nr:MBL fold metallo-hydrolase [Lachnospiraceae bacterium]
MLELKWLGQMGLIIRSENTALCIDYYATDDVSRQTPVPIPAENVIGIDGFLGTHDHLDHIDHNAWKIWAKTNPGAKFVFPAAHYEGVLADGVNPQNAIGLNDGETVKIGNMTIHAIAAAHEFLDRDPLTGHFPYLQYIIESENVRIHHAGDTVRYEGMLHKIKAFGNIDVQLLPINGRDAERYRNHCIGNMTYQEAVDLAGEVEPRIVIPGHWDMFADNSADPQAFEDYLDVKYEGTIKCLIPEVMEKIVLAP